MSGVAHSLPEPPEPEDQLDWKCRLCGAEDQPLMLGPWREGERYLTITRCRDWRACAARVATREEPPL